MRRLQTACATATTFCLLLTCPAAPAAEGPRLVLHKGDRLVFAGDAFAERMVQYGYFETLLQARFPELGLTCRNLGWSANTPAEQLRTPNFADILNFGDMNRHLTEQKADVILFSFGMSDSFAGEAGLPAFEQSLEALVKAYAAQKFNGKSPPRLAFISPVCHERLGGDLPDPAPHNRVLKMYVEALRKVAAAHGLPFADLFGPTEALMSEADGTGGPPAERPRLTVNGIHLNAYGYWAVAPILLEQLGLGGGPWVVKIDAAKGPDVTAALRDLRLPPPPPPAAGQALHEGVKARLPRVVITNLPAGEYALKVNGQTLAKAKADEWQAGVPLASGPWADAARRLHDLVGDKNQQFFYRWRAVNGEYIYGRRKEPFGVVNFPGEMQQLDRMVAERDARILTLNRPPRVESARIVRVDD
jgi:lysophospholipase L1-like esterase